MADFVAGSFAKSTHNIRPTTSKLGTSLRMEWSLYDGRGRRKYLVQKECGAFLHAALQAGGTTASFCAVLALSGARISEVLALTPERIDDAMGAINFETLKRRKKGVIRAVPVPRHLLSYLDSVHSYRKAQRDPLQAGTRLWPWCRTTAWRHVKIVMRSADNPEFLCKPKALRHAFGAQAASKLVSLTLIKKWMGHASLRSTEVYTTLVGAEERALAERTWHPNIRLLRRKMRR